MISVYLNGVGVWGPGLSGWDNSKKVLADEASYCPDEMTYPAPAVMPPNERRRSSSVIRLAIKVSLEAIENAGVPAEKTPSVFSSAIGEGDILHRLCESLALPEKAISPTLFHNSVHNAAAGYWSIVSGSKEPSVSLSSLDTSFTTGFIEAATQTATNGGNVLLAAYDTPMPEPIGSTYLLSDGFGVALVLSSVKSEKSIARLDIEFDGSRSDNGQKMRSADLERLRLGNPGARCLPLLGLIANETDGMVALEYMDGAFVNVEVSAPC